MEQRLTKVLIVFIAALILMSIPANAAAPELLGTPVKVSENRGRIAVDIDGAPFIAAFAYDRYQNAPRNSLLLINPLNGHADQYWFPEENVWNGDLFHMLRATNGCIYTTIGQEFVEFNLEKRAWTFHAPIDGMAMTFTEGTNGKIYFGTYPKSTLWEFDPTTRQLRDVGQLDATEEYPSFLGMDKFGWVYAVTRYARNNLVAINVKTGQHVQLIDEAARSVDIVPEIFHGQDGKIYCRMWNHKDNPLFLLEDGKMTLANSQNVTFTKPKDIHFQYMLKDFPDGGKIVTCDLPTRKAEIVDKGGKTYQVSFDYATNGSRISSLTVGNDGMIYGSTDHPMHMWKFNPAKSTFTDYTGITEVDGGNFPNLAPWKNKVIGGTYSSGAVYLFDPAQPWTNGDGEDPNPRLLVKYPQITRPRVTLILNDGHTAVFSGYPGYGHAGGGMVFYNLETNQAKELSSEDLLPGQSTIALRQLPDGRLVGGTSTATPGGGKPLATKSVIYLMDPNSHKVLSQTEIGPDIFSLEVLPNGNVVGITHTSELFIFDSHTRKVLLRKDVHALGDTLNAGQSLIREKNNVYLILSKSISQVSPDGEITKLTDLPENATSGTAILDGALYYASSSHLWKYPLPIKSTFQK